MLFPVACPLITTVTLCIPDDKSCLTVCKCNIKVIIKPPLYIPTSALGSGCLIPSTLKRTITRDQIPRSTSMWALHVKLKYTDSFGPNLNSTVKPAIVKYVFIGLQLKFELLNLYQIPCSEKLAT